MASNLISLAGWYFLPNLVTGYVQAGLYAIFIRAGERKPQPGTARFARDRRTIQILVIVAYLLYTVYEADEAIRGRGGRGMEADFYTLLGVPHDVDERAVQSRFRRLTVQFHPDKQTHTQTSGGSDNSDALYIRMKLARDILVDPVRRFLYDRFGPESLAWQASGNNRGAGQLLLRDAVFTGAQSLAGFYAGSAGLLILLRMLGVLKAGLFWRLLIMGGLALGEWHVVTRPRWPWLLTACVNPLLRLSMRLRGGGGGAVATATATYLPFQAIALARKLVLTVFIAISQLGPLLQQQQQGAGGPARPQGLSSVGDGSGGGAAVSPQYLDHTAALTQAADNELSRLMGLELNPFIGDAAAYADLRSSLQEWLVQNTIRNDPEVKAAIQEAVSRKMAAEQGQSPLPSAPVPAAPGP